MAYRTTPPTYVGSRLSDLTVERLQQYQQRQMVVASLRGSSPCDSNLVTYANDDSVEVDWHTLPRPAIRCGIRSGIESDEDPWVAITIETNWHSMDEKTQGVISNYLYPYPVTGEEEEARGHSRVLGYELAPERSGRIGLNVVLDTRDNEVWLKVFFSEIIVDAE